MEFVSASAGSGKTTELTTVLSRALAGSKDSKRVRPEGVVAVTFTRKAAGELRERVRRKLIVSGQHEAARTVELGLIGTVHSVCGRLVQEFSFELGISPDAEIIPEGEADAIVARALTRAFDEEAAQRLEQIARRLGIESLQKDVQAVSTQARSNAIDAAGLTESAQRSIAQLRELLDTPLDDDAGERLDQQLKAEVDTAIATLRTSGDTTKVTAKGLVQLEQVAKSLANGEQLPWHEWARLAVLPVSVKMHDAVARLQELAGHHIAHPRFHADLAAYVNGVFGLARQGLEHLQAYKTRRRLLDYVDLETLALKLLSIPAVADELRERLDLLLVDEFQDTNPIQLELFLRLARLAGRVVWVGDEKQSIFGFRGADPELVRAVVEQLVDAGDQRTLSVSYRSRPDIVRFASAAFARGMAGDGIGEKRVALTPQRTDSAYDGLAALEWWLIPAANIPQELAAVATRLAEVLAAPPQIVDRLTAAPRSLRPGDVAILCRTNVRCAEMANALEAAGVRAAIARPGLLTQLEVRLALAALKVAIDSGDSLAAAEVSRLASGQHDDPDAWLQARLQRVAEQRAEGGKRNAWQPPFSHHPTVAACAAVATQLGNLSPSEALDAAIDASEVFERCLRWGHAAQRRGNLEKLRALAIAYEEHCRYDKSASTAAGLVLYLDDVAADEADLQAEGVGAGAVQVLTYHRAKGLEWPVVVASGLEKASRGRLFEPVVEPPETFDATAPLAGRWIRLWPWPYGGLSKGIVMGERAEEHPAGQRAARVAAAEARRLLYVGFTRARDQLVLATRLNKKGKLAAGSLKELEAGSSSGSIFTWPDASNADDAAFTVLDDLNGQPVQAVVRQVAPPPAADGDDAAEEGAPERWFATGGPHEHLAALPPLYLGGSSAELPQDLVERVALGPVQTLGEPFVVQGDPDWTSLGTGVHRFLGADLCRRYANRKRAAEALLAAYDLQGVMSAGDWLIMGDRLRAWIDTHYADAGVATELPLHGTMQTVAGIRTLIGDADLVLSTGAGGVVVDHKCHPFDSEAQLRDVARGYAPQLVLYASLLQAATGAPVRTAYIHFPVAGRLIEMGLPEGAGAQLL